jgi:hypothetical protein
LYSFPPGGKRKLEAVRVFKVRRNTIQQPDGKTVDGKKNWGGIRKEIEDLDTERRG